MKSDLEKFVTEYKEGKEEYKSGDLCLGIFCKKCDAQFEINPSAVALCLMTNGTIWDFIKAVQNDTCKKCNPEGKKEEMKDYG